MEITVPIMERGMMLPQKTSYITSNSPGKERGQTHEEEGKDVTSADNQDALQDSVPGRVWKRERQGQCLSPESLRDVRR